MMTLYLPHHLHIMFRALYILNLQNEPLNKLFMLPFDQDDLIEDQAPNY